MLLLPDTLQQLRQISGAYRASATESELAALSDHLHYPLNAALLTLYRDHNGVDNYWAHLNHGLRVLRLMSIDEVMATDKAFLPQHWTPTEVKYFWTDDDGRYAGVYMAGILAGKVCFYDHEERIFAPLFRSVDSFYHHALTYLTRAPSEQHVAAWYAIPADYPVMQEAPDTDADDSRLATLFTARFNALDTQCESRVYRHFLGFSAMNFLPWGESPQLLPFTEDNDMWIQARACELIGQKRYLPALPRLQAIALTGTHNGSLAAIRALGALRTPEAKQALLAIQTQLPDGYDMLIRSALDEVDNV